MTISRLERFEEFDRSARVVRAFTRVKRAGHRSAFHKANVSAFGEVLKRAELAEITKLVISQYDKHLLNRKPPRR